MNLAVINGNNNQQMRGVARVQGEIPENADLKTLVGNGYVVITISPKKANAIRAWSVWKAIPWRPAWKIIYAFRTAADAPVYSHRRS